MKKLFMVLILLSLSSLLAKDIKIEDAYVRATPPNLPNSAAFMTVKNDSDKNIAIIKAFSNVSNAVELHIHQMKNGIMKMYPVPKIDIPAHGQTVLKPGGFHIMFIGLHHPLKKGESVILTLKFSNGEEQTVTAPIKTVMGGMKYQMKHGS
jgi:periplasmic copper chaperone A